MTPPDHVLVLFGATGDLARRKLLPGLFHLSVVGLLPEHYRIVGSSPLELSDEEFRERTRAATEEFGRVRPHGPAWDEFAGCLSYARAAEGDSTALTAAIHRAEDTIGDAGRRLHYLSVPPSSSAEPTWTSATSSRSAPTTHWRPTSG
ncbi:MAG TPA: hypothetical protein VGJ13_02200 [Pseudonocardiaceae bacterium]